MARKTPSSEFDRIVATLVGEPEGLNFNGILARLEPAPPRRTLQRRIAWLVREGRLRVRGGGRSLRYLPRDPIDGAGTSFEPPISPVASDVRALVRRPVGERRPVGYARDFLDDYHSERSRSVNHRAGDYCLSPTSSAVIAFESSARGRQLERSANNMKKTSRKRSDELRPEYDLSNLKGGVRGKYYQQAIAGTNLVLIEPALNRALRLLAETAEAATTKRRRGSRMPNKRLKRTA